MAVSSRESRSRRKSCQSFLITPEYAGKYKVDLQAAICGFLAPSYENLLRVLIDRNLV